MSSAEKKLLSTMFNVLSESKYLQENFHDHKFVYIDNLVLLDERLDEVEDVDILKKMYTYLKQRWEMPFSTRIEKKAPSRNWLFDVCFLCFCDPSAKIKPVCLQSKEKPISFIFIKNFSKNLMLT